MARHQSPEERAAKMTARWAVALRAIDAGAGPGWAPELAAAVRAGERPIRFAERKGLSRSRAYELLNDPNGEKARKRKGTYTCSACGGEFAHDGSARKPRRCADCERSRNAERNRRIIDAWNEGQPEWYIAEQEGLRMTQVRGCIGHARERGERVELHRKRNRTDWPEIERLYREGRTLREIGEAIGDSPHGVSNKLMHMRRVGIGDLPARGRRCSDEDVAELEAMWERGDQIEQIAAHLKITPGSAAARISRLRAEGYDFPRRRPGRRAAA